MAKVKSVFVCQSCGNTQPKWTGQCNNCNEWNTLAEEIQNPKQASPTSTSSISGPTKLSEVQASSADRIDLRNKELNRVLGGGLVPGSFVLCAGEPGIGKSTLMLQVALELENKKVLYVSGEESEQQIKLRAERIGAQNENCLLLTTTALESVLHVLEQDRPDVCIIDSIQTMHTSHMESAPGSVGQIRECAAGLMRVCKERNIPIVVIGHITKDGHIAGPKVLEHMVDVVLHFEGDRNHLFRLLRANKNRFGSTQELGIYEMRASGLIGVENPSEVLMTDRDEAFSGIAIGAVIEGVRPMLIEVQALVSSAAYGTPQRSTTGVDMRRLSMLVAVLEKKCGIQLGNKDVFLNIAGGIRVDDPGLDLAVISAILSSNIDNAVGVDACFAGEVGLSGEVRPVSKIDQRIAEAERLGLKRIFISKYSENVPPGKSIEVVKVSKVADLVSQLFL